MDYLHNYFYKFKEWGEFTIEGNKIKREGGFKGTYIKGQYIKIVGSIVNEGVYKVLDVTPSELTLEGELSDENYKGYLCSLAVPKAFVELCKRVNDYNANNKPTDMISESFGGYSYTRNKSSDGSTGWTVAFKGDLRPYRKMYDGFKYVKEL